MSMEHPEVKILSIERKIVPTPGTIDKELLEKAGVWGEYALSNDECGALEEIQMAYWINEICKHHISGNDRGARNVARRIKRYLIDGLLREKTIDGKNYELSMSGIQKVATHIHFSAPSERVALRDKAAERNDQDSDVDTQYPPLII